MKIQADSNSVKDFANSFNVSKVALVLSLPVIAILAYGGWNALIDPSFWSGSESEVLRELTLPTPQTLGEIKEELKKTGWTLGESLGIKNRELSVYPILNNRKAIQQIRVYQAGGKKFRGKLHLVDAVEVAGLAKSTIEAPRERYNPPASRRGSDPIVPFTELTLLGGLGAKEEIWFLAAGKSPAAAYGLIFYLSEKPQFRLHFLREWVSPVGKMPQWQEAIDLPFKPDQPDRPEIVIDQTLAPEPFFEILRLVSTGEPGNPYELRNIELRELGKLGKTYTKSLALARSGLWSPAIEIWKKPDQKLSVKIQEQHAYLVFHAKLTAQLASQEIAEPGEKARNLLMDGQFAPALEIAIRNEPNARSVISMLKRNDKPLWNRVQASLQTGTNPKALAWGSIIVMTRSGLPSARQWLYDRRRETPENLSVLDALDVAPLNTKPQQFLGTVKPIDGTPDDRWYIPPGQLTTGQIWYLVKPMVIRDNNIWKNSPIAEFGERSPKTIWKALGMGKSNVLNIIETDRPDYATFFSLTARSIFVDSDGNVEILASGSEYLGKGISANRLPIVAVSGGNLSQIQTQPLQNLNGIIADRITRAIYGELGTFGEVSLDLASFQERLKEWKVSAMDINGDNVVELVLQIQQDQIDLGSRYYPMIVVFNGQGDLIYSTIRETSPRNWVGILPSGTGGQILTEIDGRYEIWDF